MTSKKAAKRKEAEAIVDKYCPTIREAMNAMRDELKPWGYKVRWSTTPDGEVDLEAYIP